MGTVPDSVSHTVIGATEVPAVDVIDILAVVVVDSVVRDFELVVLQVQGKIRVRWIDTAINHSLNHSLTGGARSPVPQLWQPRLLHSGVGA
jgi:hypothetical protein